jgi:phosphomannomutase
MMSFLKEIRQRVPIAVVGGSDMEKIFEQLGTTNRNEVLTIFDFLFAENGLTGFHGIKPLPIAL